MHIHRIDGCLCAFSDAHVSVQQSVPIYTFSQFGSILFLLNFGLDHDVGLLSAAVAAPPTNRRGNGGLRRADAAFSQGGASICLLMSHKAVFHVVSHGLVATSVLAGECVQYCATFASTRHVAWRCGI